MQVINSHKFNLLIIKYLKHFSEQASPCFDCGKLFLKSDIRAHRKEDCLDKTNSILENRLLNVIFISNTIAEIAEQ